MAKKQDVAAEVEQTANPVAPVEVPEKEELTEELEIALERELRRYVKKGDPKNPNKPGGYRKGITEEGKKKAQNIMKRLGRKELKWNFNLVIPGYDQPNT